MQILTASKRLDSRHSVGKKTIKTPEKFIWQLAKYFFTDIAFSTKWKKNYISVTVVHDQNVLFRRLFYIFQAIYH